MCLCFASFGWSGGWWVGVGVGGKSILPGAPKWLETCIKALHLCALVACFCQKETFSFFNIAFPLFPNCFINLVPFCFASNNQYQGIFSAIQTPSNIVSLPAEMATKICNDGGHWFQHPDSNRTWTNYTSCNAHTNEGRVVGHK